MAKPVKVKKTCCGSRPRCKRCPVVWERLEKKGWAERISKRRYAIVERPPKKALKAARQR